jgi:ABC-type glycerol-3-phosphate transport system permease component
VLPGLLTLGLFTFHAHWNSYLWPSIIVGNDPENYVLSVAVKEFEILCSEDYGPLMAASIITILPVLVIFTIGQKYFMNNLTFSGVK